MATMARGGTLLPFRRPASGCHFGGIGLVCASCTSSLIEPTAILASGFVRAVSLPWPVGPNRIIQASTMQSWHHLLRVRGPGLSLIRIARESTHGLDARKGPLIRFVLPYFPGKWLFIAIWARLPGSRIDSAPGWRARNGSRDGSWNGISSCRPRRPLRHFASRATSRLSGRCST